MNIVCAIAKDRAVERNRLREVGAYCSQLALCDAHDVGETVPFYARGQSRTQVWAMSTTRPVEWRRGAEIIALEREVERKGASPLWRELQRAKDLDCRTNGTAFQAGSEV